MYNSDIPLKCKVESLDRNFHKTSLPVQQQAVPQYFHMYEWSIIQCVEYYKYLSVKVVFNLKVLAEVWRSSCLSSSLTKPLLPFWTTPVRYGPNLPVLTDMCIEVTPLYLFL